MRAGLHIGALRAIEAWLGSLELPEGYWGCSAGAIIATALAFRLTTSQIERLFHDHMTLSAVLHPIRLSTLAEFTETKGLFSMEAYEAEIVTAFKRYGIDLTTKTIADAPLPLHIVASNMTTQTTAVFANQVRILDALRCSSCIPGVFRPQVLYNNVYLDGGVMVDCLDKVAPPTCLVLHIGDTAPPLYPSTLATVDVSTFFYAVYRSARGRSFSPNVVWLRNSTIGILQELTTEQKDSLAAEGASQMTAFLSKRFPKEVQKPLNSSLPTKVDERSAGL